jgi:uncharacterized SAM-dependent methyltransferase
LSDPVLDIGSKMPSVTIPSPVMGKAKTIVGRSDDVEIIDIRGASEEVTMKKTVLEMLSPQDGQPRKMPTMLLYDDRGLQLFEAITHLDEYYLTNREIKVLEQHAADIAAKIAPGTLLVELGSG